MDIDFANVKAACRTTTEPVLISSLHQLHAQSLPPGSHIGHSAATAVHFRVAATAPTPTEIRIVPLDVADTEGRNVAVTGPDRHFSESGSIPPPPTRFHR